MTGRCGTAAVAMTDVSLKLVLLGHKNVGKTSVFNRYVYEEFGKTSMTIGAYFGMKLCKVGDRSCNLAIWDTAGEEKFDSLTNFYCRQARAALVCYGTYIHPPIVTTRLCDGVVWCCVVLCCVV